VVGTVVVGIVFVFVVLLKSSGAIRTMKQNFSLVVGVFSRAGGCGNYHGYLCRSSQ
jgi:hypothetical protein